MLKGRAPAAPADADVVGAAAAASRFRTHPAHRRLQRQWSGAKAAFFCTSGSCTEWSPHRTGTMLAGLVWSTVELATPLDNVSIPTSEAETHSCAAQVMFGGIVITKAGVSPVARHDVLLLGPPTALPPRSAAPVPVLLDQPTPAPAAGDRQMHKCSQFSSRPIGQGCPVSAMHRCAIQQDLLSCTRRPRGCAAVAGGGGGNAAGGAAGAGGLPRPRCGWAAQHLLPLRCVCKILRQMLLGFRPWMLLTIGVGQAEPL